jgi:NADH-quinone oxidoreductase subunit G
MSQSVVEAAANVAWALNGADRQSGLIYCVPECNTMGVAMMQDGNTNELDQLFTGSDDIDVAIVVENDLFRRASADKVQGFLGRVKNLVVIDQLDNPTASASDLVLPAAAFSETEATLVNYEGRAQRSFAAYLPKGDIQGSWQWLIDLAAQTESAGFEDLDGFDAVTADVAAECANLAKVTEAAPTASYRSGAGQKIPRMTHRASGRTAMLADVTMHEPKQPVDETSALAFTMEGASVTKPGDIPASMRPHIWSPGWNSNQAIVKFQNVGEDADEVVQGVRMIVPAEAPADLKVRHTSVPAKAQDQAGSLRLVPGYHLFGSEELSACSDAIAQLVPGPHISVNSEDAGTLGVASHDGLQTEIAGEQVQMEVIVNDSVAKGCAVYSYGIDSAKSLVNAERAVFKKAENWESARPSNLIKSDR